MEVDADTDVDVEVDTLALRSAVFPCTTSPSAFIFSRTRGHRRSSTVPVARKYLCSVQAAIE